MWLNENALLLKGLVMNAKYILLCFKQGADFEKIHEHMQIHRQTS